VVTTPLLTWTSSSGAISYDYCFDATNNNQCDTVWVNIANTTSAVLSGLSLNTTYYWQVRANYAGGVTNYADGNTWWSFTTLKGLKIFLPVITK
jgi:hypothetical protein